MWLNYFRINELTGSCQGLVHRAVVEAGLRDFSVLDWLQPDHRHLSVELFGPGFYQLMFRIAPSAPLQKQPVDEATALRTLNYVVFRSAHHLNRRAKFNPIKKIAKLQVSKVSITSTSNSNEMISIEMWYFRAKFCNVPVKNAWGKKNPEIQKLGGIPSLTQFCKKSILWIKSATHAARGFNDG